MVSRPTDKACFPLQGVEGIATSVSRSLSVSANVSWHVRQWNYRSSFLIYSKCSGGQASPLFGGKVKHLVGSLLEAIRQEVDWVMSWRVQE
jgi:hypothetical protein